MTSTWFLRRDRQAIYALVFLIVLANVPGFVNVWRGSWPFADDAPALFGPWREFGVARVREGVWPLWNGHLFAGLPFMGNGQSAMLYPPNLVYLLLPIKSALLADGILHGWLLAIGGFALGKSLKLSRVACIFLAICLGLGASVGAHLYAGHATWHAARAWLPWQLCALHLWSQSGQMRYSWALGAFFALQFLSGYPPLVLLSLGLCAVYVLSRMVWTAFSLSASTCTPSANGQMRKWPHNWPLALTVSAVVSLGLSSVALLPLRESSALSVHGSGLDWATASQLSGTWKSLVRLIVPELFGGNNGPQWSLSFGSHEEAASIGTLPFLLAVFAPFWMRNQPKPQRFAVWILSALMGFAALMALGSNTPVYGAIFDAVKPLRQLRFPVRWLELWFVCAAIAAAMCFNALSRFDNCDASSASTCRYNRRRVLGWLCAGVALVLIAAAVWFWWQPSYGEWWMSRVWRAEDSLSRTEVAALLQRASTARNVAIGECLWTALLCGVACWLCCKASLRKWRIGVCLLAVCELLSVTWRGANVPRRVDGERFSPPRALTSQFQAGQRWDTSLDWRAINAAMPLQIDLFNGYDAMNTRQFWQFARAVERRSFWQDMYQPINRSAALRVAGVTHSLTLRSAKTSESMEDMARRLGAVSPQAQSGDWLLWKRPNPWPRAYVTRNIHQVAPNAQAAYLQVLADKPLGADFPVLLSPQDAAPLRFMNVARTSSGRELKWNRSNNALTLEVESEQRALLVLSEAFDASWKAWVNNRPVPLRRANILFGAVEIGPGRSQVQVVYQPQSFRLGAWLSCCALCACVAALTCFCYTRVFKPRVG